MGERELEESRRKRGGGGGGEDVSVEYEVWDNVTDFHIICSFSLSLSLFLSLSLSLTHTPAIGWTGANTLIPLMHAVPRGADCHRWRFPEPGPTARRLLR